MIACGMTWPVAAVLIVAILALAFVVLIVAVMKHGKDQRVDG